MAPLDASDTAAEQIDNPPMRLQEHLLELRRRLLWSALTFALAFVGCYTWSPQIYLFLAAPLAHVLVSKGEQPHLIYTALSEAFFTYVKVALFGATFVSFPLAAIQLWKFVAPGLYRTEKRAFAPFLIATPVLFVLGAALAYYFVFPLAWKFFLSFEAPGGTGTPQIQLLAKVSEYLDLVMKLMIAFGISFELPVALSLCARLGLVQAAGLRHCRRYAYVGCFALAAVLTPPDVITMSGLALALIGLYEVSIIAARMVEPMSTAG
jgi:sec-independent protein translocase protein TatC